MIDSRGAMSRKGGWYDEADDYYDDDDDYHDDDDDAFGAYDTGSLAPKKSGASGGGKPPGGAGGKKSGGLAAQKAPHVSKKQSGGAPGAPPVAPNASAMARTVSSTPREKGVSRPDAGVPATFPAAPPSTRGGFGFDAPSPDDAVLAKRRGNSSAAKEVPAPGRATEKQPETNASEARSRRPDYASYAPPPEELRSLGVEREKKRLHLVVLGHVDAGKSTLFGRVMHVLGSVSDLERHRNARDARAAGKASFAWALALDARPEERARGVTVDVAKVFLDTGKTLVHLMDAPGHRDFVPNAIAGAAQADAACLVVDASRGAFESGFRDGSNGDSETGGGGVGVSSAVGGQTREHVRLARSLGVEHLIVAVSKMDACAYSQARFEEIKGALAPFMRKSGFADDAVAWTPVSGADGTNLVPRDFSFSPTGLTADDAKKRDDGDDDDDDARERRLERERALESFRSWYPEDDPKNLCLVAAMDAIPEPERGRPMPLRFPASELVGAGDRLLGPCAVGGKVEAGSVRAGDTVVVAPAGILATVKAVRVISSASENGGGGDSKNQVAFAGDAADIGLDLPDALCLVPGTVLCHASFPLVPATRFTVKLVTLDALRVPLLVGTTVVVHAYASSTEARVTKLVSSLDKKNGDVLRRAPRCVSRDAAAVVELTPSRALAVERFEDYQKLGRVQLRRDGATVALGVVVETFGQ